MASKVGAVNYTILDRRKGIEGRLYLECGRSPGQKGSSASVERDSKVSIAIEVVVVVFYLKLEADDGKYLEKTIITDVGCVLDDVSVNIIAAIEGERVINQQRAVGIRNNTVKDRCGWLANKGKGERQYAHSLVLDLQRRVTNANCICGVDLNGVFLTGFETVKYTTYSKGTPFISSLMVTEGLVPVRTAASWNPVVFFIKGKSPSRVRNVTIHW